NVQKLYNKEIAVYRTEKRYMRKDRQLMWGSLTVTSTYDKEGRFLYYLGVIEDITRRKNAEEKLIQLNERISTATRASRVGIWDWDVKNNVLAWDDQMYALYGLKKEEFSGAYEAWTKGLYADDSEFSQNETRLALIGEKEYDTEFRVLWPDGTIHYIKASGEVFRNETGEPVRMVGINYDITDEKKIAEKIREKDQEFRKLSANVPDLIFQFTRRPDGTYFVPIASEGIRNIFGCTPEDVLDDFTPIARVIYPMDADRVIREIEYSAEHLNHFTCEFRVSIPGKDIQWIYSNSSPEKLPDGSVTWYGFNVDITQKKLAEEALRELNETLEMRVDERTAQLKEANKELDAFSYSVSHDLRSPLRHINGFADILSKQYSDQLTGDGKKYLNIITDSAKKMGTLIDDLLSFSRTGRSELKKSILNMNLVIDDALVQIKPHYADRKIDWKISQLPAVPGDYNLIRLVWSNLIDNALKYTKTKEKAVIKIGFEEEETETVFFIKDNGAGFDMKYAQKLFGVFQRMHSSSEFEGTGIGLANVRRIILRHGGRTWAEAQPDKGATFYFSIPKQTDNNETKNNFTR
ncbi:MAG TPA: PAS domain-containing protein, partial [Bacteroidales bacterium]|nr:PAS domain-containing protein [Bacteroidales bacterium]